MDEDEVIATLGQAPRWRQSGVEDGSGDIPNLSEGPLFHELEPAVETVQSPHPPPPRARETHPRSPANSSEARVIESHARRNSEEVEQDLMALLRRQDQQPRHNAYDDLNGRPTGAGVSSREVIQPAPRARPRPVPASPSVTHYHTPSPRKVTPAEVTAEPSPFRRTQAGTEEDSVVYLNLYDLPYLGAANGVTQWLGVPAFHSGVQVFGREYGYGGHDDDFTGIYEVEPRMAENYKFRDAVLMGRTMLTPAQVHNLLGTLQAQFKGNEYDVTSRNCNHFSDVLVMHLVGRPIPSHVNRLARGMSWFAAPISFLPNRVTRVSRSSRSSQSSNSIRASRAANKADREAADRERLNRQDADPNEW